MHSSNYSCYMLRTWTSEAVHKQLAFAVQCSQIAFALEEASAPLEVVGLMLISEHAALYILLSY